MAIGEFCLYNPLQATSKISFNGFIYLSMIVDTNVFKGGDRKVLTLGD
jgi:hypothetical protein